MDIESRKFVFFVNGEIGEAEIQLTTPLRDLLIVTFIDDED